MATRTFPTETTNLGAVATDDRLLVSDTDDSWKAKDAAVSDVLSAANMPTWIDAAKIGWWAVSNTEFGYLDGVTSAIQTQLAARELSSNKSTDTNLGTSDTLYPSQKAVKTYVDGIIAAANAIVLRGSTDCSTNPNYPAADKWDAYIVTVAGKIGWPSWVTVEAWDMLLCLADSTASWDHATVWTYWAVINRNIDFASISETNTWTATTKAVTPDALAGSVFWQEVIQIVVVDATSDVTTGDGKAYFHAPSKLNWMNLVEIHGQVITAWTTWTTDIQIANVTDAVDVLSTKLTIDSWETGSNTAATPAVINTSNDDIATNDLWRVDVDAVSTTKPKWLIITLVFQLP